jgi:hypothetical protein
MVLSNAIDLAQSVSYDDTLVNPSIGATDVQAALDYFKVNGDTVYPLLAPDGSSAAPSYSYASENMSGWYVSSPGVTSYATNGTSYFDVDGNVGNLNMNVNLSMQGAGSVLGLSTLFAQPATDMQFCDATTALQLTIPQSGDQVVVSNQLMVNGANLWVWIDQKNNNFVNIFNQLGGAVLYNTNSNAQPFVINSNASPTAAPLQLQCQGFNVIQCGSAGTPNALGFFGDAPVIQQDTSITDSTFVAGVGTPVNDASTFDGYTLGQVVFALREYGLLL